MPNVYRYCALNHLGSLRIAGLDARAFLQGQLSNDMALLASDRMLLAGFHNPQGRVIALLRLATLVDGAIIAILPHDLAAPVAARLRRFVLRSKVTITDESANLRVIGIIGDGDPALLASAGQIPGAQWWRVPHSSVTRAFMLRSNAEEPASIDVTVTAEQWRALDLADGLPEIFPATSEQFVAQMLNLDCIDGISFSKGCYTGQEIIARAHYRGRLKRRMQRFATTASAPLPPGTEVTLSDGRGAIVVDSVSTDGRCEFLAVTRLEAPPHAEPAAGGDVATLPCTPLPLPYSLPD